MNNVILSSVMTAVVGRGAKIRPALRRELLARTAGNNGRWSDLCGRSYRVHGMPPGEIRACYRLYAAHRKAHEIYAFPGTIPAASNAGNLDDLAVLLRLQTGLEELVRDIGHRDSNDDLRPALTRSLGRWRKMLASFAAQLFGSRRSGGALR